MTTFFGYAFKGTVMGDSELGKCHFLPGGGAPENWGDQVLCLRSKGGSKDFFKLKRGITYIF